MQIERRFTRKGESPYNGISFEARTSEIRNPDGRVIFRQENVIVPSTWSQIATDILAQKYFRKAGVPARLQRVEEETVPSFLWRSVADAAALDAGSASEVVQILGLTLLLYRRDPENPRITLPSESGRAGGD